MSSYDWPPSTPGSGSGSVTNVATSGSVTGGPISTTGTISLVNDSASPGNNKYYGTDGTGTKGFFPAVGAGTVTSVAMTVPSVFTITGSPITGAGTLAVTYTDPGANVLVGWDDTDNALANFTIGAGLTYDHPTHTLSATGTGTVISVTATSPIFSSGGAAPDISFNPFDLANNMFWSSSQLTNLTTGQDNVMWGGTGTLLTSGSKNYLFGTAGAQLTTGVRNVLMGWNAGSALDTQNDNTGFGFQAGSVTTGNGNTFLGSSADDNGGVHSNSIALGFEARLSKDNQFVVGSPNTPVSNWKIRNIDYVMPSGYGATGDVLTDTDGAGTLAWLPAGSGIGDAITGGTDPAVLFIQGGLLAQDPTHFGYVPAASFISQITDGATYDTQINFSTTTATLATGDLSTYQTEIDLSAANNLSIFYDIGTQVKSKNILDATQNISSVDNSTGANTFSSFTLLNASVSQLFYQDVINTRQAALSLASTSLALQWTDGTLSGGTTVTGGSTSTQFQDTGTNVLARWSGNTTSAISGFVNQTSNIDTGFMANDRIATMGIINAAGNDTKFVINDTANTALLNDSTGADGISYAGTLAAGSPTTVNGLTLDVKTGKYFLGGAVGGILNSYLFLDDANQRFNVELGAGGLGAFLEMDRAAGFYNLGAIYKDNRTWFQVDDTNQIINFFGEYNAVNNSSFLEADFASGTVRIGDNTLSKNRTIMVIDDALETFTFGSLTTGGQVILNCSTNDTTIASGLNLSTSTFSGATPAIPINILYADIDVSGGACAPQLPTAPQDGKTIVITDFTGNAGTNNITVTSTGGDTIRGGTTLALNTNYQSITFHYRIGTTEWVAS